MNTTNAPDCPQPKIIARPSERGNAEAGGESFVTRDDLRARLLERGVTAGNGVDTARADGQAATGRGKLLAW